MKMTEVKSFTNFEKEKSGKIEKTIEYLSCALVPVSCLFLTIYLLYLSCVNYSDRKLAWHVIFGTLSVSNIIVL